MFGVDLIVSSLCLHHLNDAKKQYLYKAAAERMSPRGALLIADLIDPQHPALRRLAADQWDAQARRQADALGAPALFERFVDDALEPLPLSRRAPISRRRCFITSSGCATPGFAAVDCCWLHAGHAVFGGFKQAGASAARLRADS